jgi:hypothetical protein
LALVQGITCAARSSSNTRGGLLVAIKMQIRRGTLAAWDAASNPVLEPGELGFVTDVGKTAFKIGDTAGTGWNTLPYVNSTYPELLPDAGGNLDLSIVQGRYQLLTGVTYTNVPATDFTNTTTDGNCLLFVTVPSTTIVIQELTTSLTTCKRFIRAKNNSTWTAWKRIDNLSASESLSITNLTLSGRLFASVGSASAPSITITGDTTTGIYQSAAQQLGIATNGVSRVRIGDSLTTVTTGLTVSSTLTASNALTVSAGAVTLPAGSVAGAALADNGVTVAKLAQLATLTVLGNSTAGTANVAALTSGSSGTARTALGLGTNAYSSVTPLPAFQVGAGVGQVKAASAIASVSSNDPITFGASGETWFVIVWKQWQNLGSTGLATIEVLTAPKNYVPQAGQWGVIGFAIRTA